MNATNRKFPSTACSACGQSVIWADDSNSRPVAIDPHVPVYMLIQAGAKSEVRISKQPRAKLLDKTTLAGYMVAHAPICRGARQRRKP